MTTASHPRSARAAVAFLIGGLAAVIWAVIDQASYTALVGGGDISLRFIVGEVVTVPLFGIVMRDVWRSSLTGGAFATARKAATPLIGAVAVVVVPIAMLVVLSALVDADVPTTHLAVVRPAGVVYAWLLAETLYGRRAPAAVFLVAVALLTDLICMLVAAAAVETPEMLPMWLGLVILSMAFCQGLRRFNVTTFWPYVLVGAPLSWFGLHNAGLHGAFALVPLVPFMARSRERDGGQDTLTAFESFLHPVVDIGIALFALANVGFLASPEAWTSEPVLLTALSLVVGSGLGVFLLTLITTRAGLLLADLRVVRALGLGVLAGLAFALAAVVYTAAMS